MAAKRKTTARKAAKRTTTKRKTPARKSASKTKRKAPARKTAARKSTARKSATKRTAKKSTARKSAAKKTTRKSTAAAEAPRVPVKTAMREYKGKSLTRAQQIKVLADATGLKKQDVKEVVECMEELIQHSLDRDGQLNLNGLMKIVVNKKKATKARKGINPFTGEETIFKAKPARKVVKIRPLSKIKEMVA